MKKLGVTYLMKNSKATMETYLEIPCGGEFSLLAYGDKMGIGKSILLDVLEKISILQGRSFDTIEIEMLEIIEN